MKNIVFDLGNVLLDFKPEEYLKQVIKDDNIREIIFKNIFKSGEWLDLDRGVITSKQAVEIMTGRCPDHKESIEYIMNNWMNMLTRREDTINVLQELYNKNSYNLYVLSNFHKQAYQVVVDKHSFFELFAGIVISSQVKSIKPEKEIYEYLLESYSLKPEETVFIDDTEENVKGAEKLCIKTIHYQDADKLKDDLAEYGILN